MLLQNVRLMLTSTKSDSASFASLTFVPNNLCMSVSRVEYTLYWIWDIYWPNVHRINISVEFYTHIHFLIDLKILLFCLWDFHWFYFPLSHFCCIACTSIVFITEKLQLYFHCITNHFLLFSMLLLVYVLRVQNISCIS